MVRYDAAGNCQYVAIAQTQNQLDRFLDAGFIEVSEEEYRRCEAIVDKVTVTDLARIVAGIGILSGILSALTPRQTAQPVTGNSQQLENLIAQFQRNSANRTRDYFAGNIDLQQWYDAQARQIVRNRIAARAAAVGGIQNLTQQDIDRATQAARRELTYLAQFRGELANGTVSEARAVQRAGQYGGGAREQFEEALQMNIGLPPLPAQPGVRTDCHRNCKCTWDIVRLDGVGNFDCYWRRSPVDSCDTCITRERAFSPLQVRNGVIRPFPTSGIYS